MLWKRRRIRSHDKNAVNEYEDIKFVYCENDKSMEKCHSGILMTQ